MIKLLGLIFLITKKEDIKWDSLTIANDGIKLDFVVMRYYGQPKKDKHFDDFWETSKKNELIRGAYHFIEQMKTL